MSEIFTHGGGDLSQSCEETADFRHFFKLARALLQ
jgi:hypothetical protein